MTRNHKRYLVPMTSLLVNFWQLLFLFSASFLQFWQENNTPWLLPIFLTLLNIFVGNLSQQLVFIYHANCRSKWVEPVFLHIKIVRSCLEYIKTRQNGLETKQRHKERPPSCNELWLFVPISPSVRDSIEAQEVCHMHVLIAQPGLKPDSFTPCICLLVHYCHSIFYNPLPGSSSMAAGQFPYPVKSETSYDACSLSPFLFHEVQ